MNGFILWGLIALLVIAVLLYVRNHTVKVKRELANARDAYLEAVTEVKAYSADLSEKAEAFAVEAKAKVEKAIADAKAKRR